MELTTEQKFSIASYRQKLELMSEEDVRRSLVKMYEQLITLDVRHKQQVKEKWGL